MGFPSIVVYSPHPALRIEMAFTSMTAVETHVASSIDEAADLLENTHSEILVSPRWDDRCLTPYLRWIQSVASGVEPFPLERLRSNGVALTSARFVSHQAMAEHALGLLLALRLEFPTYLRQARQRIWNVQPHGTLSGSTVAVLGLGAVGEALSQRLSVLGVTVIGTKRNPDGYDGPATTVFPGDATSEACDLADAIVICVPLDDSTRGMIGNQELDALGYGHVVNVSRGPVVEEEALREALIDGRIAGAGLDVMWQEPLPPESKWWDIPNVILTPHVAGKFHGYGENLASIFLRNLRAFTGNGEWFNRVV